MLNMLMHLARRVQGESLTMGDTVYNDNLKYIKGDIYVKGHFLINFKIF